VASWFSRGRQRIAAPTLRARSVAKTSSRADLEEFTPTVPELLGRAAYVQLMLFENLGRAVATAPTTAAKAALGRVAERAIGKHRALMSELDALGLDSTGAMEPFTAEVDEFQRMTQGSDWFELVLTCYLTAGFLGDFSAKLASGLDGDERARIEPVFTADWGEHELSGLLNEAMEENPRLGSRLAMWGRRLVGDTMLVARASLRHKDHDPAVHYAAEEARIEPVFTELVAAHTRRMDALGLTA
jgi:hypothetical protein